MSPGKYRLGLESPLDYVQPSINSREAFSSKLCEFLRFFRIIKPISFSSDLLSPSLHAHFIEQIPGNDLKTLEGSKDSSLFQKTLGKMAKNLKNLNFRKYGHVFR